MKSKPLIIFLIVLLSLLAIWLTILMIDGINGKTYFSFFGHNVSSELVHDEEYESEFSKISIEASASDIYISESDDEKVRVIVYGDKDQTKVINSGGTLEIVSKEKPCIGICINFKIAKIEVYLPSNYEGDIDIVNKYGDIKVAEFNNANMNVVEDCGDVTVLAGKNVTVENKYGDITIDLGETLKVNESAGDVKIGTAANVKVKNNYGDIKINKVTNYLDIENDCGDVEINNVDLKKDSRIKSSLGDIEIGLTNEIYIDAKTSLGDVDIKQNYNKSDITLKLENSCGDIEVNN